MYPSDRAFGNYAIALTKDGKYSEAFPYYFMALKSCSSCTNHYLNFNNFKRSYGHRIKARTFKEKSDHF
jgi:hypothetical protein